MRVSGHENLALLLLILYREGSTEEEMSTEDRRAPGTTRMPFEGLVEVGGALGPSFEAQAVNVSEDGMLLRTAYLPEAGQPLTCRFDAGSGESVLASGEVVWAQGGRQGRRVRHPLHGHGPGERRRAQARSAACGCAARPPPAVSGSEGAPAHRGARLADARARSRTPTRARSRVGSDLGFLQVGKHLELEDAQSGTKRPACIDRVEVAVDPASHVPQLVVTLRYATRGRTPPRAASARRRRPRQAQRRPPTIWPRSRRPATQMKGAVARSIARIGPAIERLAQRAKTTIALLAARRRSAAVRTTSRRRVGRPRPRPAAACTRAAQASSAASRRR